MANTVVSPGPPRRKMRKTEEWRAPISEHERGCRINCLRVRPARVKWSFWGGDRSDTGKKGKVGGKKRGGKKKKAML